MSNPNNPINQSGKVGLEINNFTCQLCTQCCKNMRIDITFEDMYRWIRQDRRDLLEEIRFITWSNKPNLGTWALKTTAQGQPCIFLGTDGLCSIHDTKPLVCKNFPFNISEHRVFTCPGVNKGKKTLKNKIKKMRAHEESAFSLTVEKGYEEMEDMLIDYFNNQNTQLP